MQQDFRRDSRVLSVGTVPAPTEVADRLNVEAGDPLIMRRYHITLNDVPAQIVESYFRPETIGGSALMEPSEIPGGTHAYLATVLDIDLGDAVEDLVARMPTPDEAGELRLAPGTPVVELIRTIHDHNHGPIEVSVFVFAADRFEFRYTVPMS